VGDSASSHDAAPPAAAAAAAPAALAPGSSGAASSSPSVLVVRAEPTSKPAPVPILAASTDDLVSSKGGADVDNDNDGSSSSSSDSSKSGDSGDKSTSPNKARPRAKAKSQIHSMPKLKLPTSGDDAVASRSAASAAAPAAASPVIAPKMSKPNLKLNIGSLGMSGLTGASEPIKPSAAETVAAPGGKPAIPSLGGMGKLKLNLGGLARSGQATDAAGGATAATPPAEMSPDSKKLFALKQSTASPLAAAALAQRSDESAKFARYQPPPAPPALFDEDARRSYAQDRENHKLYHDSELHSLMLQLIFSMLTSGNETLDPLYTAQYPLVQKKLNIPFILHQHINWPENRGILTRLQRGLLEHGTSAYRLFKLLSVNAFHPTVYANLERVATGAYGVVYFSDLIESPRDGDDDDDEDDDNVAAEASGEIAARKARVTSVAVKLMNVPQSVHDRCVLHDIFTEILILEHFRADPDACRLFDYGLDHEHYWITMKRYCGSLKEWRIRQRQPLEANLVLYMNIFEKMLRTIYKLHGHHIIHFDIKCDNFFIEPHRAGATLEELVNQATNEPTFSVALGDFGESMVYSGEDDQYTTQNRGTEYIRSPEMLAAANRNVAHYDRRRRQGATTSSDVWSLGCALYELCTTEFLFYDGDWGAFFTRVTSTSMPIISQQRKLLLNNDQVLIDFLEYVFIRDPLRRPTIEDVIKRFGITKRKVQRRGETNAAAADPALWDMINDEDRPHEREPRITRNLYEQERNADELSQITESLLVSNATVALRRGQLSGERGITHIIQVTVDRERKHGAGAAILVRADKVPTITTTTTTPAPTTAAPAAAAAAAAPPVRLAQSVTNAGSRLSAAAPAVSVSSTAAPTQGSGSRVRAATLNATTAATSGAAATAVTGGNQFVQLNVILPLRPVGDELLPAALLTRLFEFARRGSVIGKVLVCSHGSTQGAAAVVCALLMAEHDCCFEAAQQLLERRRPGCRPSVAHAAALEAFGDRCGFSGLVAFSVPDYRCLCGSANVTLRRKLHVLGAEPRPCRCEARRGGELRHESCPSLSCAKHLVELNELYGYNADYIKWASVTTDNVVRTTFAHTTELAHEWSPTATPGATVSPDDIVWRTFRCRMCKFITHAVSNRGQLDLVIQYRGTGQQIE
jgi:serine/threonine protein kinase